MRTATQHLERGIAHEILKKNQLMRKNNQVAHGNTRLLAHSVFLEKKVAMLTAKIESTRAQASVLRRQKQMTEVACEAC